MIKNEQSRDANQQIRTLQTTPTVSLPPPLLQTAPMLQTTSGILSQRLIDTNAIDITSLRGQFAWEKIPNSDTYMPVIFRNTTKYFCIRMLRKLLPDYPEDVIRRSYQYQYRKPIDVYSATTCEIELLNRINSHHSRWTYSRQAFTKIDELVAVSDFIPYYEHLRQGRDKVAILPNSTAHTIRQLVPQAQPQQNAQRVSDFMSHMPTILRGQTSAPPATSVSMASFSSATDFTRESILSTSRSIVPIPTASRTTTRPSKPVGNPYAILFSSSSLPQQTATRQTQQIPSLLNNKTSFTNTVPSTVANTTPVSLPQSTGSSSSSSSPIVSSSINNSPSSVSPIIQPPPPPPPATITNGKSSTATILSTKPSRPHYGWLQINKLYTPFISPSATDHHLYKLPVSLLSFYELLKTTPSTDSTDSKDCLVPFEQIPVTCQEIEIINELCLKQNIQPFNIDTKLIELSTFYRYCSANIIFVKELPLSEPKASICKDWMSIVQINGGICRLRNITTLHEQTVPFIGNNLLKNFILSSQCLSTASLSKPTSSEIEFLQLILFFSNMPINLRNAQLIDIQSVKKEYNVDLILLFNDKFPLNVLNYQQQGNQQPSSSQTAIIPTNSTNTIAESTPPPSPPSPAITPAQTNNTSQLPLTSSGNRYQKTVEFHGHSLIAFICSGLGTNDQRECVSIKSLCNILYPNSSFIDKLEMKMLRLLRLKNVNRFRPQNQQSLGFTRLIDIKDAEKHWDYIEQEMQALLSVSDETSIRSSISSESTETLKASTTERVETNEPVLSTEISVESTKGEKRLLDNEPLDEEDIPVLERINKRAKMAEKENDERLDNEKTKTNEQSTDKIQKKRTIKLTSAKNMKKRLVPSTRTNKELVATWVKKYNIDDCCIRINQYDPTYDTGTD